MQPNFAKKLSLCIYITDVNTQNIDGSRLKIYKMIITTFQVDNKNGKLCFFKKTFLLADISIDVTFGMFFFILSNIEVNFNNQEPK